jgi:hypothetical protein
MDESRLLTNRGIDFDLILDSLHERDVADCRDAFLQLAENWGQDRIAGVLYRLIGAKTTPAEFTRGFIKARFPKDQQKDPDLLAAMEISSLAIECIRRSMNDKDLFKLCFPVAPPKPVHSTRYGFMTEQSAAIERAILEPARHIAERMSEMNHHSAVIVFPKKRRDGSGDGTGLMIASTAFEEVLDLVEALVEAQRHTPGAGPC